MDNPLLHEVVRAVVELRNDVFAVLERLDELQSALTPVVVYDECSHCHAEVREDAGESKVVFVHRVEGQAVGTDVEWFCFECLEAAEEGG